MADLHSPSEWLRWIGRNSRRLLVFIVGVAILLAGLAMLALPGPGVLVIIVGLLVLATEFAWAERALDATTERAASVATKVTDDRRGRWALAASGIGLIVGGIALAVIVNSFTIAGVSLALAGAIGLATLHPAVGRWIEEKSVVGINETDDIPA